MSKIVGAGWFKKGEKGDYISISFKEQEMQDVDLVNSWVNMSVNSKKTKPTHPDYLISVSPKASQQKAQSPKPQQRQQAAFPEPPGWDSDDPGF